MLRSRAFLSAFATLVFFTALAGDAWRNTISWLGWGILAAAIVGLSVALLISRRRDLRPHTLPYPLLAFLVLATASIAWSAYPSWTALGSLAQWASTAVAVAMALLLDWRGLLRALSRAIAYILGLSLLFELVVAAFVRQPVFAFWTDWELGEVPVMYQWSRALLFEGGPIQGIVGNSSTLGFIAMLGVIVFTILCVVRTDEPDPVIPQDADALTRRRHIINALIGVGVSFVVLLLTASATIAVTLVAVAIMAGLVLVMHRILPGAPRAIAYVAAAAVLAGIVAAGLAFRDTILALLGKSSDLTGRLDIWQAVADVAAQRPVGGWGWVSYWVPWVEPFDSTIRIVRNGTQQLHAHNAWLDVSLQLGVIGVIVFAALIVSTFTRAWFIALDGVGAPRRYTRALSMLPLLLLTALLVQSVAESRILVEYGWLLLAYIAVSTRALPVSADSVASLAGATRSVIEPRLN
ncbi:O-antigen ligase family protein [Salinibacterium hongtaonis]|nr:O-antigen ligase family protein [Salinibacterium hongtaonis]